MASSSGENPFRYGAIALDEAFTDREEEVAELVADVVNGQDVVIFAPRRFGKSSLVWRTASVLARRRVLVGQVDLMTTPTKPKLAAKLAETIFENIASRLDRARERAFAPFRNLRIQPTITIEPEDGSVRFHFDVGRRPADIDATLERLLELPAELAAARGRKVALIFDEFQEIVEIDPGLPKLMRSLFQLQPEVSHVYLGSRRHVMDRIFNDENEPFWRSAKAVELGPIEGDVFAQFLVERFAGSGKRLAPAAAAEVLERTGGHPYATQELAYFLWEQASARRSAGEAEVGAALEALLRAEHAHFSLLWERASKAQRLLLEALARDQPARPLGGDYRREHGLPAASTVQRAARALVEREVLAREGAVYRIAEPFLGEWIATTIGGS